MLGKHVVARSLSLLAVVGFSLLLAAACGSDPTPTPRPTPTPAPSATATPTPDAAAAFQTEWAELLAAAQDEGGFVISIGGGGRNDRPIAEAFGEQFGIDVTVSAGRGSEQTDKLLAEQSASKYEVDVLFIDGTNGNRLIQADALLPIMDVVFHPDILDLSNWYQGRIWFGDPEETYIINHSAAAAPLNLGMYYNTNNMAQEDLDGFNSVYDYLDPKWAGKIVSLPPTIGGGVGTYVTLLLHPDVGEDWLSQYFHPDHDVFFSEDSRIVADGIANGKFHFGIALSTAGREVRSLAEAGAPIDQLVKPFAEADTLSGSGPSDNIEAVKNPPHPNSQKLFINWFLSQEGQSARLELSAGVPNPTLREDVPCEGNVDTRECRDPDATYINVTADPKFTQNRLSGTERYREIWHEVRGQ